MATQDWVEKIRKLLALAEAPCSDASCATENCRHEYEREQARERAYALMTKFEIEEAALRDADRAKLENIVRVDWKDLDLGKTYAYELTSLIAEVADAHGMKGLIGKTYRDRDGRYVRAAISYPVVIGFEGDVTRLRLLVESLVRQCNTALAKHMKTWTKALYYRTPSPSEKYNERRGFIIGYGQRLAERIEEARKATVQEAVAEGTGTALVLVDKAQQVESWWMENVAVGKGAQRRYSDGIYAGRSAANGADLGQARMGGARGAIES